MSSRLSIRIPPELRQDLDALVQATGKTESAIVREALADYRAEKLAQASCYDLVKQSGWVAPADDLPSDLSTNPEHMEGFGRD